MRIERSVENLQYATLICLLVAQTLVGKSFILGQCLYLVGNAIAVFRSFTLDRPLADKTKDCACLGLTIALICANIIK